MSHGAYREAHPLLPVITHWVHLLSMVLLAFTGFYIHDPFFEGDMQLMRTLHFIFMYVVLIALVARLYFLLFGFSAPNKGTRERKRDVKAFLPQEENKGQFLQTIKYYLFLRKTHPISGKYNPLQKLAYTAMAVLLLAQAYTGFAIYGPSDQMAFFAAGADLMGGLMVIRQIHYLIMWLFIVITLIHVYLSVAEDVEALPLMFAWREKEPSETH